MKVEIEIERLVLHGVPAPRREAVGAAVRAELGRLVAERGVPASLRAGGALVRVDGGSVTVAPDASPRALGAGVAGAVYRGIGG